MGFNIYNLNTEILIHDVSGKTMSYIVKEGAKVNAVSGSIIITAADGSVALNATPDKIDLPSYNGIYEIVTEIHGYLQKPFVGDLTGGWGDYNDFATATTPISVTGGAEYKVLTNDKLGSDTNETKLPFGVTTLWDSTTNKINLSELSVGDTVGVRVSISVTTALNNTEINVILRFGVGGSAFDVGVIKNLDIKTSGVHELNRFTKFYIGSENVRTNGVQLMLSADKNATVKVIGWFIEVTKISS